MLFCILLTFSEFPSILSNSWEMATPLFAGIKSRALWLSCCQGPPKAKLFTNSSSWPVPQKETLCRKI